MGKGMRGYAFWEKLVVWFRRWSCKGCFDCGYFNAGICGFSAHHLVMYGPVRGRFFFVMVFSYLLSDYGLESGAGVSAFSGMVRMGYRRSSARLLVGVK